MEDNFFEDRSPLGKKTFTELFQTALKKVEENKDDTYYPDQLDCLFRPVRHLPKWEIADVDLNGLSKDVQNILKALKGEKDRLAFVLIAPAFYGQFRDDVTPGMIRAAFRDVGFDGLLEVAVFADILTLKEALEFDANINSQADYQLTSCCCPMWIAMIKRLYGDLMPHVPPSVSPMIAAGRTVKKIHRDALTVFVGPCMAKKAEAKEKDLLGAVDFVLTFQETNEIFSALKINLSEQQDKVREHSSAMGRIYARTGGVSQAVKETLFRLNPTRKIPLVARHANGVPACKKMIEDLKNGVGGANFFEGMGCLGGCVGGPKSLLPKEVATEKVNTYGDKALYRTPLDNPYVLELLSSLNFTTLESLVEDKDNFFTRDFFR